MNPSDGSADFQQACACDREGREAEAIPHYERALARGLPPSERAGALLGLGSSLRNVGRHEDAARLLAAAVNEFPDDAALKAFLALALYSRHDEAAAMRALLDLVIAHAPVGGYARALTEYRNLLR